VDGYYRKNLAHCRVAMLFGGELGRDRANAGIVRVRLLSARHANVWPALHNLPSPPCSTSSPYKN